MEKVLVEAIADMNESEALKQTGEPIKHVSVQQLNFLGEAKQFNPFQGL